MIWSILTTITIVFILFGAFQAWKRLSVSGNIHALTMSCETLERSPTGESKLAYDRLVKMGRRALPALRRRNQQLIAEHVRYSEALKSGPSWNPYENCGQKSHSERRYRYVIEIRQARVVDVIEEIEHSRSPGAHSVKHMHTPRSGTSFCVTLVGTTPAESDDIEGALRRARGSFAFGVKRTWSATTSVLSPETVHAIVFSRTSLARATPADVAAVRTATEPGTCRVYLSAPAGEPLRSGSSPVDDFIQRTSAYGANALAEQIIAFFREADDLNRRSTVLAFRDMICRSAYRFLKVLWPLSYLFATLHVINAIALVAGRGLWPPVLQYMVPAASFFGAFFIVHCIFVVFRNTLFAMRIVKGANPGFVVHAGVLVVAAAATARSVTVVDGLTSRIFVSTVLAVSAYVFYMYARRVRAECTSLSQLQAAMADGRRRADVLSTVGKKPFTSGAFPILPVRSHPLFISYMHGSEWSSQTAALIHRWTVRRGCDVVMDQSSIPSGALWRQFLMRSLSKCGFFIAVLDGEAATAEWVLVECAYAALLRKSIGKPRILLLVRNEAALAGLRHGPFGILYMDLFHLRPETCFGAAILIAEDGDLSEGLLLRAMEEVRPMCLLGGS